jgi:uncharacterized protein (TIGR02246 family)
MESDRQAVRDALTALDKAFERQDLRAVRELCTEDVVFIGSGEGEEAVGRDAIGPMFDALSLQLEGVKFSLAWESVEIDVLGGVALISARGSARLETQRRADTLRYRLTGVLVRSTHGWRWRVYHGSEPGAW